MNLQMNQIFDGSRPEHTPGFTEKQGQYLAFIWAYTCIQQRPPAEADMQRYFKVTAPSVHQMVIALERTGFINRTPGLPRSIAIRISPETLPTLKPARP